jgi:prephenate dehydrogenase
MWTEILRYNRTEVTGALAAAGASLAELARLLEADDADGLLGYLAAARRFREGLDR